MREVKVFIYKLKDGSYKGEISEPISGMTFFSFGENYSKCVENILDISSDFRKENNIRFVCEPMYNLKNKGGNGKEKPVNVEKITKDLSERGVIKNTDVSLFKDITSSMLNTYIKKNHDYGNSFEQSLDEFGLIAAAVRINDKINRLKSLVVKKNPLVEDESIRDTVEDMANYCIMTAMWLDKQEIKKNLEDKK